MEDVEQQSASKKRSPFLFGCLIVFCVLLVGGFAFVFWTSQPSTTWNKPNADIHTIATNLIRYKTRSREFPTTAQGLDALVSKPTIAPIPTNWAQMSEPEGIIDPWGNPYQYQIPPSNSSSFADIWSMGPDGVSGTKDDIGNWE